MRVQSSLLKRSLPFVALSAVATAGLVTPALAYPNDFVGTWKNTDTNNPGITRLVVEKNSSGKLTIRAYGKCHPSDCDFGKTSLVTYGKTVSDKDHIYATANYTFSFKKALLALELNTSDRKKLCLRDYNQFTDNSGRQDYSTRECFKRS